MSNTKVAFYDTGKMISECFSNYVNYSGEYTVLFKTHTQNELFLELSYSVPDLIFIRIRQTLINEIELIKKIKTLFHGLPTVAYTSELVLTDKEVIILMNAGISTLITDQHSHSDIMTAIKHCIEDGIFENDIIQQAYKLNCIRRQVLKTSFQNELFLTERESKIIDLKSQGLTSKEVGNTLFTSEKNIDRILGQLYRRFDVKNFICLRKIHSEIMHNQLMYPSVQVHIA